MLVFTRKLGESVVVTGLPGPTIELRISVVGIRGGRVRLGFEAESDVTIDRAEMHTEDTRTSSTWSEPDATQRVGG